MERDLGNAIVADAFPYRLYSAIDDERTSKPHRAMEGLGIGQTAVYYKDDPVWKAFRPPWGARHCRCGWIALTLEQAASMGLKEAKQWFKTGLEPPHEIVALPPFSLDSQCEPGTLYASDNPLILDDLRSGVEFRVERAMTDVWSLVASPKHLRLLADSLLVVSELIGMADALLGVDKNALAAWPALISCFISRMSRRRQGEVVSYQGLVFEAMRNVLNTGAADEREQILPVWIASEDADANTLVEILGCNHWEVRKAATERLGQLGHAAALALTPLECLLSDRSKYVRAAASDAIKRIRSI